MTALRVQPDALTLAEAARIMRQAGIEAGSWIYAVQADGYGGDIKIGFTARDPVARFNELQRGTSQSLRGVAAWPGVQLEEKILHETYAWARIRGEWFMHHLPMYQYLCERGGDFRWHR